MSTAETLRMTEREYLAFERASRERHELVNGEVVAMAGASPRHNHIVGNITGALWSRLRGRPCAALPADQRVHVPRTGLYAYPDVTVVCGAHRMHPEDDLTVLNPAVVFEVLASSVEAQDRRAKASHDRSIPGLSEYVPVAHAERRVEHYRRLDGDRWLFVEHAIDLAALGVALPLDEVYEGAEAYPGDDPARRESRRRRDRVGRHAVDEKSGRACRSRRLPFVASADRPLKARWRTRCDS